MALIKRPLTRETAIAENNNTHSGNSKHDTDCETAAKRKRLNPSAAEENNENNNSNDKNNNHNRLTAEDKHANLPQKKRNHLTASDTTNKLTEDQDDETLIRETQAALKSLSGSWPETKNNPYRMAEQDEQPPAFQNLFEEKQKYENKHKPIEFYSTVDFLRFHRQKENDQTRSNIQQEISTDLEESKRQSNFSAFKPPNDIRRNNIIGYHGSATPLYPSYTSSETSAFLSYPPINSHIAYPHDNVSLLTPRSNYDVMSHLDKSSAQSTRPTRDDTKQYTVLQPAGSGSRAASVLQDINRNSSTSSTVASDSQVSSSSTSSSLSLLAPSYSPGSINRGKFCTHSLIYYNSPLDFYLLVYFLLIFISRIGVNLCLTSCCIEFTLFFGPRQ